VTLPTLSTGTDGNFNAVVFADSPFELSGGEPAALATYESTFGVRQIDGYSYPSPLLGQTDVTVADISGTTGTLTTAVWLISRVKRHYSLRHRYLRLRRNGWF